MLELNFVISRSRIRQMCIDHNWCTGMTNEEYYKILDNPDTLNEKGLSERIAHIADEIIRTSDNFEEATKAEVMTEIFTRCVNAWYEDTAIYENTEG